MTGGNLKTILSSIKEFVTQFIWFHQYIVLTEEIPYLRALTKLCLMPLFQIKKIVIQLRLKSIQFKFLYLHSRVSEILHTVELPM